MTDPLFNGTIVPEPEAIDQKSTLSSIERFWCFTCEDLTLRKRRAASPRHHKLSADKAAGVAQTILARLPGELIEAYRGIILHQLFTLVMPTLLVWDLSQMNRPMKYGETRRSFWYVWT